MLNLSAFLATLYMALLRTLYLAPFMRYLTSEIPDNDLSPIIDTVGQKS